MSSSEEKVAGLIKRLCDARKKANELLEEAKRNDDGENKNCLLEKQCAFALACVLDGEIIFCSLYKEDHKHCISHGYLPPQEVSAFHVPHAGNYILVSGTSTTIEAAIQLSSLAKDPEKYVWEIDLDKIPL